MTVTVLQRVEKVKEQVFVDCLRRPGEIAMPFLDWRIRGSRRSQHVDERLGK